MYGSGIKTLSLGGSLLLEFPQEIWVSILTSHWLGASLLTLFLVDQKVDTVGSEVRLEAMFRILGNRGTEISQ